MKQIFEFFIANLLLIVLFIPILIIIFIIKFETSGPAIYWSKRVGKNNKIYLMPKFRTMKVDSPDVATHLLKNPDIYITNIGKLLRRFSLDEIPQLYSIIIGDMSFVGPRPALYNQYDLINLRNKKNINHLKPGITGWAQINGRDSISLELKVELDYFYMINKNTFLDIKIIFLTLYKAIRNENILH